MDENTASQPALMGAFSVVRPSHRKPRLESNFSRMIYAVDLITLFSSLSHFQVR